MPGCACLYLLAKLSASSAPAPRTLGAKNDLLLPFHKPDMVFLANLSKGAGQQLAHVTPAAGRPFCFLSIANVSRAAGHCCLDIMHVCVQASSTRMSRLQQATQSLEERLQDREQQLLTYQVKLQQLQGMLARREAEMRALPEPTALEQLQRQVGIAAVCQ